MTILSSAINSQVISSVSYDVENLELTLTFRTGRAYRFVDVEYQVYNELLNSDSVGQFFNDTIRNNYQYETIDRDTNFSLSNFHIFQSEFLQSASYNGSDEAIISMGGRRYACPMVRQSWEEFIQAESAGAYFTNFLRSNTVAV